MTTETNPQERKYKLTYSTTAKSFKWETKTYNFYDLCALFTAPNLVRVSDEKDGTCVSMGELMGKSRKGEAMRAMYVVAFDIDGGQSFDEAKTLMDATGYTYFMVSSYNHLTEQTIIPLTKLQRYAMEAKIDVTGKAPHMVDGVVQGYLETKGGGLEKFGGADAIRIDEARVHNKDGQCAVVHHNPIEKFRVILPLDTSVVMMDLGVSSRDALDEWKRLYHSVGKAFGLKYDHACSDPSRAFYLPAHAPGNEAKYRAIENLDDEGKTFLDANMFDVLTDDELGHEQQERPSSGKTIVREDGKHIFREFDVDAWYKRNMKLGGDALYVMMQEVCPEYIKGTDSPAKYEEGYRTITCPFEDYHSTEGGTGTYMKFPEAGDEKNWPMIRCSHDHCKGNITESYLLKMLQNGWLEPKHFAIVAKIAADLRNDVDVNIEETIYSALHVPLVLPTPSTDVAVAEEIRARASEYERWPDEIRTYLRDCESIDGCETFWNTLAVEHGIPRTAANEVLYVAHTDIGLAALKEHGCSDVHAVVIGALRRGYEPYETFFDGIYASRLVNDRLRDALNKVVERYGIPFGTVEDAYMKFFNAGDHMAEKLVARRAAQINDQYAKIGEGQATKFIDMQAWEGEGELRILTRAGLKDLHSNETYEVQYSEKSKAVVWNAVDYWLKKHPGHTVFTGYTFNPSTTEHVGNKFNLWRGLAYAPRAGSWKRFLKHIYVVICRRDPVHFEYVIKWMAQIVQQPHLKMGTALVLTGKEGTGKSLFAEAFAGLFGDHGIAVSDAETILGAFNDILRKSLVVVMDEAVWGGDKRLAGKLKNLVTQKDQTYQRKYDEQKQGDNYTRLIFTSNNAWVVPAGEDGTGGRRWFVLDVSEEFKGNDAYFGAIGAELANGGYEAMLFDLQRLNFAGVNLRDAPVTQGLIEQRQHSMGSEEAWWWDVLTQGGFPYTDSNGTEQFMPLNETSETLVEGHMIYTSAAPYFKGGRRVKALESNVGKFLTMINGGKPFRSERMMGTHTSTMTRCRVFPPLREMREGHFKRTGERIETETCRNDADVVVELDKRRAKNKALTEMLDAG